MKLQSSNRAVLRNVTLAAVLVTGLISLPVLAADASTTADNAVKKTERVASDSWITTKVKGEILSNSISKAFKVSVKTLHGDVTLRGALPNQDAVDLVKELAEKVKGVKSVDISQLTVVPA